MGQFKYVGFNITGVQAKLADLRGVKRASTADQVAGAEALWSTFAAEHNIPFAVSDCFSSLVKNMFPDSKVADNFACRKTKTAAIITEALAPVEASKTIQFAQQGPCSLMVDESNKLDNDKACAIVLRVINTEIGRVQNNFLDLPVCNKATAENLFTEIDTCFE